MEVLLMILHWPKGGHGVGREGQEGTGGEERGGEGMGGEERVWGGGVWVSGISCQAINRDSISVQHLCFCHGSVASAVRPSMEIHLHKALVFF